MKPRWSRNRRSGPRKRYAARAGLILLIEDDSPLRKLVANLLAAGYRVLEAANGEEALTLATGQRIDRLLTNVVMPGMSGPELVTRLRARRTARDVRSQGCHRQAGGQVVTGP